MSKKTKKIPVKPPVIETDRDLSPYVFQRDKINFALRIKELPWTEKQKDFLRIAMDKNTKVMFVKGSAGTSKTAMAVYSCLKLLNERRLSDLIFVRSAVESADSRIGFLPGDLESKFGVYSTPFHDKLEEFLPSEDIKKLEKDKRLIYLPINFARGLHFAAKGIVFDEIQNSTQKEILTLLTRIGPFCKVFLLGDPMQSDLPNGKGKAFENIFRLFDDEESRNNGIFTFEFTEEDIIRSELVRYVVGKFKDLNPEKV